MPTRIIIPVWRQHILPKVGGRCSLRWFQVPIWSKAAAVQKAGAVGEKADKDAVDSIFAERMKSDPQAGSNLFSRWWQKQTIKKEYAAAKAGAATAENAAAGTAKAAQGTASMMEKAFQFVQSHSHIIIGIAAVGLLVLVIAGSVSSCSVLINGGGNVVLGTSYTAKMKI